MAKYKLDQADVDAIRKSIEPDGVLAKRYGVGTNTIGFLRPPRKYTEAHGYRLRTMGRYRLFARRGKRHTLAAEM